MAIKIKTLRGNVILPLHHSQGGIRIADEHGNHVSSPTKTKNEGNYYIEWMITNAEIKLLSDLFLERIDELVKEMKKIKRFAEDSEYSKRKTIKVDKKRIEEFEGFTIYQYNETFNSFERDLNSGLRVRITFKLGDFGIEPHPHMYVLIPFDHASLKLKNKEGEINDGEVLGSGCFGELILTKEDLSEIILTLAHASDKHRNALIEILKS